MDNNCMHNCMNNRANNIPYRNANFKPMPVYNSSGTSCTNDSYVVGMAYVPWQFFENVYDPCKGLSRGTIFPELDKPFKGGCCL